MPRLDPRTKLALGLMAIGAVFVARRPETLIGQCIIIFMMLPVLGIGRVWVRTSHLLWPMVCLVFVIASISFDVRTAILVSLRLFNVLNVSFIFFRAINPEEMGDGLRNIGIPFSFVFILVTAMRYVPLIKQKARQIMDAQYSRGIDLRPRLKNTRNFLALLIPLLVQSFLLSDELAMAMESRGFGRKGRSSLKTYRFRPWEYALITASLITLVLFACWEKGVVFG